jgi:hypothetical protein
MSPWSSVFGTWMMQGTRVAQAQSDGFFGATRSYTDAVRENARVAQEKKVSESADAVRKAYDLNEALRLVLKGKLDDTLKDPTEMTLDQIAERFSEDQETVTVLFMNLTIDATVKQRGPDWKWSVPNMLLGHAVQKLVLSAQGVEALLRFSIEYKERNLDQAAYPEQFINSMNRSLSKALVKNPDWIPEDPELQLLAQQILEQP